MGAIFSVVHSSASNIEAFIKIHQCELKAVGQVFPFYVVDELLSFLLMIACSIVISKTTSVVFSSMNNSWNVLHLKGFFGMNWKGR